MIRTKRHPRHPAFAAALSVAAVALVLFARQPASGDVFHLRGGGQVEGEETGRQDKLVRLRTRNAEITLPAERILRVEKSPLSWQVYQTLKKKYPDTAEGHYRLGVWCRKHKLEDLAAGEFARALELDSNHAPTRQALGHVRVGAVWLEPRPEADKNGQPSRPVAGPGPAGAGEAPDPKQALEAARIMLRDAEREMIQMLRAEWYKRILAIRSNHLNSSSKRRFNQGADMLLAIRDPLAVEPMLQLLSDGPSDQRKLLATVLAQFHSSTATMGLLESAVLDSDGDVRKTALIPLSRRADPRIPAYLLKALSSEDDDVVCNAADAIGYLRAPEAIPALVSALTDKNYRPVRTDTVVKTMRRHFIDENGQLRTLTIRRKRSNPFRPTYKRVTVTVFRTRVQEALMAITGENYGFDAEAWMDWYRRHVEQPARRKRRLEGPPGAAPPPAVPPAVPAPGQGK